MAAVATICAKNLVFANQKCYFASAFETSPRDSYSFYGGYSPNRKEEITSNIILDVGRYFILELPKALPFLFHCVKCQ